MRVLFLNRVFPPAKGATGDLLAELCAELNLLGYGTTVVTSRTETACGTEECSDKLNVQRVSSLPFTRASHWRRALSYLSLYPAFLWRALRQPRHEVIVTLTDPPLQLVLGPIIKMIKGGKAIHWAQDIYPEVAEELGVLSRNGPGARILRSLSTWALNRHDAVVAVGRCMRERLIARGVAPEKIVVIPNWGQKCSRPALSNFRSRHGLSDKFVVMYSGNFGLAHAFDALVSGIKRLEAQSLSVRFVFVGEGPKLAWLKEQLQGCKNVIFLPFQPREELGDSLSAADVHVASMREDLCGLVVPSKVYGVLAVGRPCIFIGPGMSEVSRLILEQKCGWVLPADCAGALSELIASLPQQKCTVSEMGLRAAASQNQNTAFAAAGRFARLFEESARRS